MNLNEILEDPGISYWLKDAIKTAYERDPVDALHDARRLLKMLAERYTRIVNRVDPIFAPVDSQTRNQGEPMAKLGPGSRETRQFALGYPQRGYLGHAKVSNSAADSA